VPLRSQRDIPRRPDDQRRRGRHRGGRRDGVDDPGPYLLPGARAGYRIGDQTVVDSMMYDGLFCAFDNCAMGLGTERYNGPTGSPASARTLSAPSPTNGRRCHQGRQVRQRDRAVSVPQRKGDPLIVDTDEGVRPRRRPSPWPSCALPSTRAEPSPPEMRHRSLTRCGGDSDVQSQGRGTGNRSAR